MRKHTSKGCRRLAPLTCPWAQQNAHPGLVPHWSTGGSATWAPAGHGHWDAGGAEVKEPGHSQIVFKLASVNAPCYALQLSEGLWWEQSLTVIFLSVTSVLSDENGHNLFFNNILFFLWEEIALSSSLSSSKRQAQFSWSSSLSTASDPSWS